MNRGESYEHEWLPDYKKDLEEFYINIFGWPVVKWDEETNEWLIKPLKDGEYASLSTPLAETPSNSNAKVETYLHLIVVDDIQIIIAKLKDEKFGGHVIFDKEYIEAAKSWVAYGADYANNWFNLIQHEEIVDRQI